MSSSFSFPYREFNSADALSAEEATLLKAAGEAVDLAYAPYSGFAVGAALLMDDGSIIKGSNQENASYPAGICAERVALAAASSVHPDGVVKAIAIAYRNNRQAGGSDLVLSPCGICRQSLLEKSREQQADFKLIMSSPAGNGIVMEHVSDLLPFAFSGDHLQ